MPVRFQTWTSSANIEYHIIDGRLFAKKANYKYQDGSVRTYFYCKTENCPATASIKWTNQAANIGDLKKNKDHCDDQCDPQDHRQFVAVEHFKTRVYERCEKEKVALRKVYDQEINNEERIVRDKVNFNSMRPTMRRRHCGSFPLVPKTFNEFGNLISENIERFGCVDSEVCYLGMKNDDGRNNIIVFANRPLLNEAVSDIKFVTKDGTFDARPRKPKMAQLFTIMGMTHGKVVPLFFAFMENRTAESYSLLFRTVKLAFPQYDPETIMSDYERAIRKAVKEYFPEATHLGCYFHFSQCVVDNGKPCLTHDRSKNRRIWLVIRMLVSTALLPADHIIYAVQCITFYVDDRNVQEAKPLLKYFDKFWIKSVKPECFSVHGQKIRCNNHQEAFHRAFTNKLPSTHPNAWELNDTILNQFADDYDFFTQMELGEATAPRRRKKWILHDQQVQNIVSDYLEGKKTMMQYLKAMGHRCRRYVYSTPLARQMADGHLLGPLDVATAFNAEYESDDDVDDPDFESDDDFSDFSDEDEGPTSSMDDDSDFEFDDRDVNVGPVRRSARIQNRVANQTQVRTPENPQRGADEPEESESPMLVDEPESPANGNSSAMSIESGQDTGHSANSINSEGTAVRRSARIRNRGARQSPVQPTIGDILRGRFDSDDDMPSDNDRGGPSHAQTSNSVNDQANLSTEEDAPIMRDFRCKVCYLKEIEIIMNPCGHIMCCLSCWEKCRVAHAQLVDNDPNIDAEDGDFCPLCKALVTSTQRVYFPQT